MAREQETPASRLVAELEARGIVLWADADTLRFRAPAGTLTDTDRTRLSSLKPQILDLLRRPRRYPLSFAQQRLWFLWRMDPASPAFNEVEALRLDGKLARDALEAALAEIVRRHGVLRSVFAAAKGGGVQWVRPPRPMDLEEVDLGSLPVQERESAAARLARDRGRQPFDLTAGPLVRPCLVRLGSERHLLFVFEHHAITDRLSTAVFERELAILYEAFAGGRPSPLDEPRLQYGEWARRERERGVDADALRWWCRQLDTLPDTDLPLDRPRPAAPRHDGAWRRFTLPGPLAGALRERTQAESATPFMGCLAALAAVLWRWSGREDLAMGTAVALRDSDEAAQALGLFVNNVTLRVDTSGDPSFAQLLRRVRRTCLDAYAHADVPFQNIVASMKPRREGPRHPLFQVALVVRDHAQPFRAGGLQFRRVPVNLDTSKFDLTWFVDGADDGAYECTLEYSTELFFDSTAERLGTDFVSALAGGLEDPSRPISQLDLARGRAVNP